MRVANNSLTMIRWRLRVLMAEKNISNKELAELSGVHYVSISKLKNTDELKQVTGDVLNKLCNGLTRAYRNRGEQVIITPGDLLQYTYDGDDGNEQTFVNVEPIESGKRKSKKKNKDEGTGSHLTVLRNTEVA